MVCIVSLIGVRRFLAVGSDCVERVVFEVKIGLKVVHDFYTHFYTFTKENSFDILDVFQDFLSHIKKIGNPEKYLLQVMELLSDEKNAKYIMSYLQELDNLSENEIEILFAYFEGTEKEVEEEKEEDIITKIYHER